MASGQQNQFQQYKYRNWDLEMKTFPKISLVILGPQGSGKGTQAQFLTKKFNYKLIAVGDIIRLIAQKTTPLAKKIKKYSQKGELLPEELIEKLLSRELKNITQPGIIFDGFPRTQDQVDALERFSRKFNFKKPVAIYLRISDKTAVKRISSRRICSQCQDIFYPRAKGFQQGICPKCQAKLIQRLDDRPKIVKNRLRIYHQQTEKIINFYRQNNRLIEINGEPTIPQVLQEILERINDYFKK